MEWEEKIFQVMEKGALYGHKGSKAKGDFT